MVRDASFVGRGCSISTASASMMTDMVKGKRLEEVEDLFRRFHGLITARADEARSADPGLGKLAVFAGVCEFPVRVKCASLAWHTLKAALAGEDKPVSTEE
jgi:nitrogen fixation NifU-like protein